MKRIVPVLLALAAACAFLAGCTSSPPPAATTAPTTVAATPTTATPVPQPSFSMGDQYVQRNFSFQSESDNQTVSFRVADPSWGIEYQVTPLNDDLQYCWFEMKVTNLDNGKTETYGYGRSYGIEKDQKIAMYNTGPYQVDLRGNRVKVYLNIAKRNP